MDQGQRAADDQTGDLAEGLPGGDAQDGKDEDTGQNDLGDEALGRGDLNLAELLQRVGAEAAVEAEEHAQQSGAGDGAKALRDHVAAEVLDVHLLADQHGNGNSGVDVAAGDVADGIGHGDDDQAEGAGDSQITALHVAADGDGGAAGHQDQDEGTDEFRDILSQIFHVHNLLF